MCVCVIHAVHSLCLFSLHLLGQVEVDVQILYLLSAYCAFLACVCPHDAHVESNVNFSWLLLAQCKHDVILVFSHCLFCEPVAKKIIEAAVRMCLCVSCTVRRHYSNCTYQNDGSSFPCHCNLLSSCSVLEYPSKALHLQFRQLL